MTMKKNQSFDLIITGGGIAGLSLACILGKQGVNVALVEPSPPASLANTPVTGRTIALMYSSLNVIRAAGLTDFIDEFGTPLKVMRLIDDSISGQNPIYSEFDARDIDLPYFGMNIPNALLRAALFEVVTSLPSISVFSSKLVSFNTDYKVEAILEDGAKLEAPLIIGADGRNSPVRKISGISVWKKDYGQTAITCIINHSRSHDNTSTEFHESGGPFALVPMAGNQSAVVWVEWQEKADALLKLRRDEFESLLQIKTRDILGGITLESNPDGWPLCTIKAKRLTAQRVALMAEAAHVMSPITAQGLNLSLRDAATLAEVIIDAMRLGSDHGQVLTLANYERRRRLDIATRVSGVNTMNQLVSSESSIIKDMRRSGLKLIEAAYPLKRLAMNHGLAPSLDQDRILKGLAV